MYLLLCTLFFLPSFVYSTATCGTNLIVNGDAESSTGAPDDELTYPTYGWDVTPNFTPVQYNSPSGFPETTDPGPPNRGLNFFAGGADSPLSTANQEINVSSLAAVLDFGMTKYVLSAYLGGYADQLDNTVVTAYFLNSEGILLLTTSTLFVSVETRGGATGLFFTNTSGTVPTGTRLVTINMTCTRFSGPYNDAYSDNLSLMFSCPTPTPTPTPTPIPIPISALTPISLPMPSPTPTPISALTPISLPMPSRTPTPISASLNVGTVAGIVCGILVFLVTVVVIIFLWKKYGIFMNSIRLPAEISWSFEEAKLGGERHEDFKMKQLEPDSKEFNIAKDLFFKHLDGQNIGVSKIFAVYPKRLLRAFIAYEENMQKRLISSPNLFQHQKWKDDDPDGLRQWMKDKFDKFSSSFPWNLDRTIKIIPQVHGTDFKTAMAICSTGFATLSLLDEGWYGKGIYFTSSGVYATPYFAAKKKPTIIIAYVMPGNPYPVIEHPMKKNNLVSAALMGGSQSHYVITSISGHPVEKPQAVCFDELVITQEAQALPAFILVLHKSNLKQLLETICKMFRQH